MACNVRAGPVTAILVMRNGGDARIVNAALEATLLL